MESADKYRQYAEECRLLADEHSSKDRSVLMDIANAWIACAEEAARKEAKNERDGKGNNRDPNISRA